MEQILILINQISVFAVMLAVGFLARKLNFVNKNVFDALTVFTVKVLLPLFMLTTISNIGDQAQASKVILFFMIFVIFYIIMYLLSFISNYIFDMKGTMSVSNMAVITTTCTGFIGLPIASAMYGAYGALIMALYSAFDNFTMWTHKVYLFHKFKKEQSAKWWKNIINPQIICVLIGILLAIFKINFGDNVIWTSLCSIGDMAKYMGMLFLGSTLVDLNKTFLKYIKPIMYIVIVRMCIFPILFGIVIKQMVIFTAQDIILLTIIIAVPPMASVPTILKSFEISEEYAAQCLIFTTLISLFTLPFVLGIVML